MLSSLTILFLLTGPLISAMSSTNTTFLYRFLDWSIGKENLKQAREDFKWIVYNHMNKFQRWNPPEHYLKKEALKAKDKARSSKWDRIGFVLGFITSMSVFITIPFAGALTVLGLSVMILTALRRAAVTMILYEDPYRIRRKRRLKFACAWNRAMNGWTSLSLMPLAVFNLISPDRYKLGLWVLEKDIQDKYK